MLRNLPFLLLLFSLQATAQTQSRLLPKKGLFVTTQNLTWASGSEINIFTADKKHHHYYFTWWEQDADSTVQGRDILYLGSSNTAVAGSYSLKQKGTASNIALQCNWNRSDTGVADLVHARLWLPYFHEARWYVKGNPVTLQQLAQLTTTELEVHTPFGNFLFQSSHPFRSRRNDAPQPGSNDYEKRSQHLLLYENDITLIPSGKLERNFTVTEIAAGPIVKYTDTSLVIQPVPVNAAWVPDLPVQQLLPRPQQMDLQGSYYSICQPATTPISHESRMFRQLLLLHWQLPDDCVTSISTEKKQDLPAEAYQLQITGIGIRIGYSTAAGLQHALHTLVQLVQNQNGTLVLPQGNIIDAPAIRWRGIHMFTGPQSWPLHRRMYERVLLPLKMNKVVLQCEQAEWKSFPNIHSKISVPLADLKAEFDWLRQQHNEPIPLIQSLGHMEWFFKPQENRKLAINPLYPYTLNADLPEARKAVKKIWDEAFRLLRPRIMHIGFDEIGMIGFHLPREKEVELWKTQINYLHRYAQKKKTPLMLWGDMGLGPGEGPDALNGITRERAALLKSTIPKGSYIADWHYINNPNPEIYNTNLRIWKENGNIPLASPWLHPNNVRGFVLAAKAAGAGLLQTTWADFESSEANMLLNIEQFGAYVLALDYAWSGRTELPEALPYHHVEEWASRFYSEARPINQRKGWLLQTAVPLRNITSDALQQAPEVLTFSLPPFMASGFRIKAATDQILQEGTPVAVVQFYAGNRLVEERMLRYGAELRSRQDQRSIFAHVPGKDRKTYYRFFEKHQEITTVKIQLLHAGSGLQVEELMLIE
ncbi:MAG TPA: glycoside hydrolase family 20 zincin-like fold domain-containing protein [Lacibacter sp.]|nr:glycoside hydrolase family 20 zincin-like fold domain-containing protein [Lacibacter sp.]HMO89155.1 glycoside hydrolase family 20 zincin-like fold domain-containing protein [Lacibacter sp.]HMP86670.1 glycoside hydrolase family 20 zincin-like fold domain-containing protein [Lacibacter sp.]